MHSFGNFLRSHSSIIRFICLVVIILSLSAFFLVVRYRRAPLEPPPPKIAQANGPNNLPLDRRAKLVSELKKESLFESVENLPNFNDTEWVRGTMNGGNMSFPGTFRYDRLYIPRLNRVRKILSQVSDTNRAAVIARLIEMIVNSSKDFPEIDRADRAKIANSKGGVVIKSPDEYGKRIVMAPAATYILSELGAHEALPVMAKVYSLKGIIPVSRLYLFYAMHLLAVNHPNDHLSPETVKAWEEYIHVAKSLPDPLSVEVPAWDASFEETDFRVTIARQNIGLENQPKIRLRIYPHQLQKLEDVFGKLSPQVNEYFNKLNSFVKLAYP